MGELIGTLVQRFIRQLCALVDHGHNVRGALHLRFKEFVDTGFCGVLCLRVVPRYEELLPLSRR